MSEFDQAPERISVSGGGVGEVSAEMIARRAAEIARNEGRERPLDHDLTRAEAELSSGAAAKVAPEVPAPALEEMTSWDEGPEAARHAAPRVLPADEASIAEQLVQEGVDEAEHDRRARAGELSEEG